MTRRRIWSLLLAGALLASLPAAFAEEGEEGDENGDDGEADGREDDRDDDEGRDFDKVRRKVEATVSGDRAEFKLEREDAGTEDEFKFLFDASEAEAKVALERETVASESETEFKAEFLELREFRDGNGNGAFDPGEPVVQTIDLRSEVSWRDLSVGDVTLDGKNGKRLTATADLPGNGTFGLVFWVFGDLVDVNGTLVGPTEVKFDVAVNGFPYEAEDTQVALIVETKHEAKVETETADDEEGLAEDEEGLTAVAGDLRFTFAWKETATVDGAETSVGSTVLKSEEETETDEGETETESKELVALAYARGGAIVHDPVLGITGLQDAERVPDLPLAAGIVAVGLAACARGRRASRCR